MSKTAAASSTEGYSVVIDESTAITFVASAGIAVWYPKVKSAVAPAFTSNFAIS